MKIALIGYCDICGSASGQQNLYADGKNRYCKLHYLEALDHRHDDRQKKGREDWDNFISSVLSTENN